MQQCAATSPREDYRTAALVIAGKGDFLVHAVLYRLVCV